jgi:uncharacterized protein YciI
MILKGRNFLKEEIMNQYISILTPARKNMHKTVTEAEMKIIETHSEYLTEKHKIGIVTFAGTSFEEGQNHFALVVVNAESKAKAAKIIDSDPAVAIGLLISNLTEFNTFLK